MQSRISCFNRTLFRKNLSRFWPLWGMASFIGALFPLAMLMEFLRYGGAGYYEQGAVEFTALYYEVVCYAVPLVSLFYAILVAIAVWSYLYNHRSVSLMHTLPIRREGLFVTNFLSGMAMLLIPYAVTGALCVLISIAFGYFDPAGLLLTIVCVLAETFFYFATATLAAFIVGNAFALPAVYFLLHFLAVVLDWLVCAFASGFIFGFSNGYSGTVEYLSPTVYLMTRVRTDRTYEEVYRWYSPDKSYYDSVLVDVKLENAWLIAVYALVGVALLGLAWTLYRRRRSESAGDVVAVGWMRPVFRYGLALLAALLGGLALYHVFWGSFQSGRYYDVLPMLFFMAAAGLIGYYAAAMLLAKSLRVFKSGWRGSLAVLAGCLAICAVLRFDVFGVAARVPEIDEVERVSFYAAGNDYIFYPGEEDALLEEVRALHRAIVDDAAYARAAEEDVWYTYGDEYEEDYARESINITYELKNGREVYRYYRLTLNRDRMQEPGAYDNLLDRLINGREMKYKRLHAGDARYTPDGGSIHLEARREGFDFSSREAAEVLEAVTMDAREGTWGTYDWFGDTTAFDYAMSMDLTFTYTDKDGGENLHRDWLTIRVRPGMTNTVACLRRLGYVTESDLVTYIELYPEDFDQNHEVYYEHYGAPRAVETGRETLVTAAVLVNG